MRKLNDKYFMILAKYKILFVLIYIGCNQVNSNK